MISRHLNEPMAKARQLPGKRQSSGADTLIVSVAFGNKPLFSNQLVKRSLGIGNAMLQEES